MERDLTLNEWKEKFLNGEFKTTDVMTQVRCGWFDWFCNNTALAKKTEFLGNRVLQLLSSPKIDCDKTTLLFKNNCPMSGPLYDDFRIAEIDGKVLFTISHIKKGCYGKDFSGWEVWDFTNPEGGSCQTHEEVLKGSWREVKKYFEVV